MLEKVDKTEMNVKRGGKWSAPEALAQAEGTVRLRRLRAHKLWLRSSQNQLWTCFSDILEISEQSPHF